MEIIDIIKEAIVFPSKSLDKLAIYIGLKFLATILLACGIFACVFSVDSAIFSIIGLIFILAALFFAFITMGYSLKIIKSGIDGDELLPAYDWKNDGIAGIKLFVVDFVYYLIPAILTVVIAFITNVPGTFMKLAQDSMVTAAMMNATSASINASTIPAVSQNAVSAFVGSILITALISMVLFIIFSLVQSMGQARLAKTGDIGNALNVVEAAKDITRIGIGKVIAIVILVALVIMVVTGILTFLANQVSFLGILSIIVSPYLLFFAQRAFGLLYADIA